MTSWLRFDKLSALALLCMSHIHMAVGNASPLKVITSADPESNAVQSFVYIAPGAHIPEGIKKDTTTTSLALQLPFVIELLQYPDDATHIQWQITVTNSQQDDIELISTYTMNKSRQKTASLWSSDILSLTNNDHSRLIFRPATHNHEPSVYKKGRGPNGQRRKYGGGTEQINDAPFNPRITYTVSVDIYRNTNKLNSYSTVIAMDNKDMIRQEYINHYGIQRYGYGENGDLPVPRRDELTDLPANMQGLLGNPLTESQYGMLVNDGLLELAAQIAAIYEQQKRLLAQHGFYDLNNKPLAIPDSQLWISSGWRNPERNEWYSNAVNGIHQRGGAVDFIIYEPPGESRTAIAYWILWQGLENNKDKLHAFWQLEVNGRPMRTAEFTDDLEPRNGIPDAFDKADHLHTNILYTTQ